MADQSEISLIVSATDNASGVLGRVGGALTSFGSSATAAGSALLPLSVAAGAVAVGALSMAGDFEQAMNVLQMTSGATDVELQTLSDTAVALGADMSLPGTSASDAAEAMLELSKAGLSVNDVLGAAKGVLQMSAAGELSNAEAATIAANALNVFGLEGAQAGRVADLLAAAANASSADVRGMALSLQMAGSVAAMTGQSLENTTTAIALMANAGIAGSDAGTSVKQMLMSLMAPSKKAADLMKELGISVYDANGKMLPMPDLVQLFSAKLGGMTDAQRNAALATIFGTDAVRAANIVLMGGTQAWTDMSISVTRTGAASDLAGARMKGFSGMLDGLKSTLETVLMTGAQPLLAGLTQLGNAVGTAMGQFAAANPQLVTAGIAFAGVLGVAGPLVLVIGLVATSLGALAAPIGIVVLALGALAAVFATNFAGIRDIVAGFVGSFTTDMTAAGNASLQLTDGLYALATTLGMSAAEAEIFSQRTGDAISGLVTWVQTTLQQLSGFLQGHATEITGWLQTAWGQIQTTIGAVVTVIQAVVTTVFGALQTFLQAHGQEILATLKLAWDTIGQVVNFAVQVVNNVIVPVFNAIAGFIRAHGADIEAIMSAAWAIIQGIVTTVCAVIQGIIAAVLAAVQGDWSGAWTAIQTMAQTVWTAIQGIVSGGINAVQAVLNLVLGLIGTNFSTVWNGIKTFLETTWTAISTTATAVWDTMKAAFSTPQIAVERMLGNVWTRVSTALSTTWTGIATAAATTWEAIKTAILTPVQTLETALSTTWENLKKSITGAWEDIKRTVSQIVSDLVGGISGMFSGLNIHIPMPHFEVSWEDIGFGVKIPKVNVNWYAKGADFWTNGPMLIGVGEAGPEHVQITPAGKRAAGGDERPIVVNINNPVVREELDIQRIAAAVSEVLGAEAQTLGRMRYQWAS